MHHHNRHPVFIRPTMVIGSLLLLLVTLATPSSQADSPIAPHQQHALTYHHVVEPTVLGLLQSMTFQPKTIALIQPLLDQEFLSVLAIKNQVLWQSPQTTQPLRPMDHLITHNAI